MKKKLVYEADDTKTILTGVRRGKVKKVNKKHDSIQNNVKSNNMHQAAKQIHKEMEKKLRLLKKKFNTSFSSENTAFNTTGDPVQRRKVNISFKKEVHGKSKNEKKKRRKKIPEKQQIEEEQKQGVPPPTRYSDDPIPKKVKWINRQRVLVFGSRGMNARDRHLMKDLRTLLPHCRPENKMERKQNLNVVNEMCGMRHCNKCILFEGRGNRDLYMWISCVPNGPSAKFLLQNIYTMDELKFTGNCLIGSRPLLSFDENFENILQYRLIKELLTQIFGTPNHHPKSQPFFDHVLTFSVLDNRIWFRNYQILSEDGAVVEIGPRFVMNPIKIFSASFCGETLWENPHYITPAKVRTLIRKATSGKYIERVNKKAEKKLNPVEVSYKLPATDEVFTGNTWDKAKELISKEANIGGTLKGNKKRKIRQKHNKGEKRNSFQSSWAVKNVDKQPIVQS